MTTRVVMKYRKINSSVVRLGCAALALPGLMQTVSAGRVEETYNADFQYGHYSEGKKRMEVDIFEGALAAPIGKNMTANVGILRDMVSGASPVYNRRVNGKIQQVLSGASPSSQCGESICEQRDQITGGATYFFEDSSLNIGGGLSREHDYTSRFFNTAYSIDLNKKLTTLNFGASIAFDDIEPSPSGFNSHVNGFKRYKTGQNYLVGVSQVVDKDTLFQSNMTFGYSNGYLTDPYKNVATEGNPNFYVQEIRPGHKFTWAWLNQYVRHFGQLNDAALHVDYRYSLDDWGSHAHTFELAWHQPIADNWQIIPRFRYYSQDRVDFYQPIFDDTLKFDFNAPGYKGNFNTTLENHNVYSSDYRLAGFGALSGGIKLSKEITSINGVNSLKFQTGFEYYRHEAGLQLGGNSQGSFADFNYYVVTASFNLKF
ncbi:hypothetical protein Metme_0172 [Methylomonas methanica MC09]|uniref:DUF3570 domain-containing protein n=2 Tax=Methylomonas methanica TaxID=421 RepID=F9ZYS5_METMM|nr:hypothetical protein Metme_0172 [Methylomonas methanica MC09]